MSRVLVALGVAAVMMAVVMIPLSIVFFPLTRARVDVAEGEAVFKRNCSSCHSVTEVGGSRRAPVLNKIGAVAATRVPGQSAEEYILNSIVHPDAYRAPDTNEVMPANVGQNLTRAEILNVVGYLASLGGTFRPSKIIKLKWDTSYERAKQTEKLELASIQRGQELFLGKANCSTCHELRGEILGRGVPGHDLIAPSLMRVGLNSRDYLKAALMNPNEQIIEDYVTWVVSAGGVPVSGRKLPSSPERVRLVSDDGKGNPTVHDFALGDLEEVDDEGNKLTRSPVSKMPAVVDLLTADEIESVIDFLKTLR